MRKPGRSRRGGPSTRSQPLLACWGIKRQLVVNPDRYLQFLRNHYTGVQTTIEDIALVGDTVRARVRFDRPASDTSQIEFILTQVDGQWKITNENFEQ